MPRFFNGFAPLATVTLATLITILIAPDANAQDLYLTQGSYTANDATYQNNTIFVGQDSGLSTTDAMNNPYVATLDVVTGATVNTTTAYKHKHSERQ